MVKQRDVALEVEGPLLPPLRLDQVEDPRTRQIMERWGERVYPELSFVGLLAHSPKMLQAFTRFAKVFYQTGTVGLPLKEMIRLRSARLIGCRH